MPLLFKESLQVIRVKGFDIQERDSGFAKVVLQTYNGNGYSIHYTTYFIKTRPEGRCPGIPLLTLHAAIDTATDGDTIEINGPANRHEEHYLKYPLQTFSVHYMARFRSAFTEQFPQLKSHVDPGSSPVKIFPEQIKRSIAPEISRLISAIIHGNPEDTGQYYDHVVASILIKILEGPSEVIKPAVNAEDIRKACEVRKIILDDFTKFDTLATLARKVGTNATKLKVSFKQLTGKTVFKFSQTARLEYVKKLLVTTDYTIQTIAEMAGYTEGNNLHDIFRRTHGCTPGNYRKMKS